jgi:hypothetical protein
MGGTSSEPRKRYCDVRPVRSPGRIGSALLALPDWIVGSAAGAAEPPALDEHFSRRDHDPRDECGQAGEPQHIREDICHDTPMCGLLAPGRNA